MKRVHSACLEQTIHFQLKEEPGQAAALRAVAEEVAGYKQQMECKHIKYKVVEETSKPDGSVMLKIKRQYNSYALGDYLD